MKSRLETLSIALAARVAERSLPPSPRPQRLPADDEDELASEGFGHAEGQTFVIEYVSSKGETSVRAVTVVGIRQGQGGVPMLFARCHLRKRTRLFRIDRITSCIDFDGEVHEDVAIFMADNFGMEDAVAARTSTEDDALHWRRFRTRHAGHLVLLSALSHADDILLESEAAEIVEYCLSEAPALNCAPTEAFRRNCRSFVRRLRPEREHIGAALDQLAAEEVPAINRFLVAAVRVIDADGRRHPEEIALVNRVAEDLIGLPVA